MSDSNGHQKRSKISEVLGVVGLIVSVLSLSVVLIFFKPLIEETSKQLAELRARVIVAQSKLDEVTEKSAELEKRAAEVASKLNMLNRLQPKQLEDTVKLFDSGIINTMSNYREFHEGLLNSQTTLIRRLADVEWRHRLLAQQVAGIYRAAAADPSPQSFRNIVGFTYAYIDLKPQSDSGKMSSRWYSPTGEDWAAEHVTKKLRNDPRLIREFITQYRKENPTTVPVTSELR